MARTADQPEEAADRVPTGDGIAGPLSPRHRDALDRFVAFWGEMASSWGINRTMALIHALLYAVEEPLDTDAIMARLSISRGNANMNLRSLVSWNLVRRVHRPGSRKDFYTAEKDVWEITIQIIREREKRELKPVLQQLQECRDLLAPPESHAVPAAEARFGERIENLMRLVEVFEGLSRTLLPFIQVQNAELLRQLVGMVDPTESSHAE